MPDRPLKRETHFDEQGYGWVIVAVATLALLLGFGANATIAVFIGPWEMEFGWRRADISLAYSLTTVGVATGGIFFGALSDRVGAKKIAFLGAMVLGLSMMALSQVSDIRAIYAIYFTFGLLGFACLFAPILALSGLWFNKRKGLAIGIVTAGGALGQGLIPFGLRAIITAYDWRSAAFVLGLAFIVLLMPLLFLLRPPPVLERSAAEVGRSNDNLWGLSHKVTLPWMALAGIFCCTCMAVPLVHLVPLAMDLNIGPQTATGILFALMTSGMVGRIVFGLVTDRIGGLKTYFIASFGQTATVFWFTQTESVTALFALGVVFGFFFAGVMTCLLIATREAAPLRMTGLATALVTTAAWLGMGIGSYQGGYFYDLTGSYTISYANAAVAGAINLTVVALLIWYRRGRSGHPGRLQPVAG